MRSVTFERVPDDSRWAVILSGGDGVRLRSLTRAIAGDERPKQFCTVIGGETLLQQTIRRVTTMIPPVRTTVMLTRHHEQFFPAMEAASIVQPDNRGTAPAILYSLLSIVNVDPFANVAIFPADHHFSDDAAFMQHVAAAYGAVAEHPELMILLGIVPTGVEEGYGWIQPGEPISEVHGGNFYRVRRFWEKPATEIARQLVLQGCLWNTFVLVGAADKLLRLIRSTVPGLYKQFEAIQPSIGTVAEDSVLQETYALLSPSDFSRDVLAVRPRALTVLPVEGAKWVDMGTSDRVRAVLAAHELSV